LTSARLGRRIPVDLSVVGVDNILEASHFWPPLTTVDQPLREAGGLAVVELDRAIRQARSGLRSQGASSAPRTLLQPQLIVRDSSRATGPGLGAAVPAEGALGRVSA
jgi:DNA-binding LacI/PurR family transcriptional regulator